MNTVTLTVLGCDGSHAGPGGAASGYLVRHWERRTAIWMDAGPGTFANLQRFCDPADLTGIVLTHQHSDHWTDVDGLITAARWTMDFARPPITVLAAPGIRDRICQDIDGIFDWHEVGDGDGVELGGFRLGFVRTAHPPVTLAVRLEASPGVIGYSADTGPSWSLGELGHDLDLALCEATFTEEYESDEDIHMSGTQAGRAAKEAGARRLVVTHRWFKIARHAVLAEARAVFPGRVDAAEIGRGFSL